MMPWIRNTKEALDVYNLRGSLLFTHGNPWWSCNLTSSRSTSISSTAMTGSRSKMRSIWMQLNIPCFECPDQDIEQIYYCRWYGIEYDGTLLTIMYDKTGEKYHHGRGLRVFANGNLIGHSERLSVLKGTVNELVEQNVAPQGDTESFS